MIDWPLQGHDGALLFAGQAERLSGRCVSQNQTSQRSQELLTNRNKPRQGRDAGLARDQGGS
jgi:hypothetical protein